jgi:hypothetical protein
VPLYPNYDHFLFLFHCLWLQSISVVSHEMGHVIGKKNYLRLEGYCRCLDAITFKMVADLFYLCCQTPVQA